jgi:hypothetical protein
MSNLLDPYADREPITPRPVVELAGTPSQVLAQHMLQRQVDGLALRPIDDLEELLTIVPTAHIALAWAMDSDEAFCRLLRAMPAWGRDHNFMLVLVQAHRHHLSLEQ